MVARTIQPGDFVVYQMTKQSSRPTLRAKVVTPSANGEDYRYIVEKFWVVREINDNGEFVVETRTGKVRTIPTDDPNLKRANLWHRWVNRGRFPAVNSQPETQQVQTSR